MKKRRVHLTAFLLLLFFVTLALSGCWSRREVNDLAFVTAGALDRVEDGRLRLSVEIALPSMLGQVAGGQGGVPNQRPPSFVVSAEGLNISDAMREVQEQLPRELFWAHASVMVIGEPLAREGLSPWIDFFVRSREIRGSVYLVFAQGQAADILKGTGQLELFPAEAIREIQASRIGVTADVREFARQLLEEGSDPVGARVALVPTARGELIPRVAGAAIFQRDRLVDWADDDTARGILWVRNEQERTFITLPFAERRSFSVFTERMTARVVPRPDWNSRQVDFHVIVEAVGSVSEQFVEVNLVNRESVRRLEEAVAAKIASRMRQAIDLAQRNRADIFGFGHELHRVDHAFWQDVVGDHWREMFAAAQVTPEVRFKLRRPALGNKHVEPNQRE